MNRIFAVLLLGVLGGGTAGFLVGSFLADRPVDPLTAPARNVDSRTEPAIAPVRESEGERAGLATVTPSRQSQQPADEALPGNEVLPGDGLITGTVLDTEGVPLAGAVIRAERIQRDRGGGAELGGAAPLLDDLDSQLDAVAREYRRALAEDREARTDSQGRYELTQLARNQRYELTAYRDGYDIRFHGRRSAVVRTGRTADGIATLVAVVTVQVERPDGTAVDDAEINLTRSGGERRSFGPRRGNAGKLAWSSESPVLRCEPGIYEIHATHNVFDPPALDLPEYSSSSQQVKLVAGEGNEVLTFVLAPTRGIRGEVLFPPALADGYVRVQIRRQEPGEDVDAEALQQGTAATARPDKAEFVFRDLLPGTYKIGARQARGEFQLIETVTVEDGMTTQDLDLNQRAREADLIATVVGPGGEALSSVRFDLRAQRRWGFSRGGSLTSQRLAPGRFALHFGNAAAAELATGGSGDPGTLEVRSEDHGIRLVELQPGQGEVRVQFESPGLLLVEVSAPADLLQELTASALPQNSHVPQLFIGAGASGNLDESGRAHLGPLQPGEYEIRLGIQRRGGRGYSNLEVLRQPLLVAAGQNQVSLTLPPLHAVTIFFPEATSGTSVALSPATGRPYTRVHAEVGASGRLRIDRLVAGDYMVLRWTEGDAEQMKISVPAGGEVVFRPDEVNAFAVSLGDPPGALARAGLRQGDLIIAINAEDLLNSTQMTGLLMAATARNKATVTVLRRNQRLELTLSSQLLLEHRNGRGTDQLVATSRE